mmetsp:Transcript_9723/g.19829  ORF Transcript_9723/g.19829 Transcript_9723/m.19829 type:complete len:293 (+) Transcript_9723:1436-2314(+)
MSIHLGKIHRGRGKWKRRIQENKTNKMTLLFVLSTTVHALGVVRRRCSLGNRQSQGRNVSRIRREGGRVTASWNGIPAANDDEVVSGPYSGHYGSWTLTRGDVRGVTIYRASVLAVAVSTGLGLALGWADTPMRVLQDAAFIAGDVALGLALWTIHIYLKPLHDALKVLWVMGTVGTAVVACLTGGIVPALVEDPRAWFAVGGSVVALTGLTFKEAFCFGRPGALALTGMIPLIAAGQFFQVVSTTVERTALATSVLVGLVFASEKFRMPPTKDIGDKSVFTYLEEGSKHQG